MANATVAAPCPLVVATVTQVASADTDQVQSRAVAIEMDPLPPLGGNGDDGAFVTLTLHLAPLGAVTDVDALLQAIRREARTAAAASSCFRIHIRSTTSVAHARGSPDGIAVRD